MPEKKLRDYVLSGPAVVEIYSQTEMARALRITEATLVQLLEQGEVGLSYHAHPQATGGEYEFNERSYRSNVKVWRCYSAGGHDYKSDKTYNYLPAGASVCTKCGHTKFH